MYEIICYRLSTSLTLSFHNVSVIIFHNHFFTCLTCISHFSDSCVWEWGKMGSSNNSRFRHLWLVIQHFTRNLHNFRTCVENWCTNFFPANCWTRRYQLFSSNWSPGCWEFVKSCGWFVFVWLKGLVEVHFNWQTSSPLHASLIPLTDSDTLKTVKKIKNPKKKQTAKNKNLKKI